MQDQNSCFQIEKPERKKFRQETVIHSFIVRPLAQEIVLWLWNKNVTPNQITVFRIFLNIISLIFILGADFRGFVLGFVLFQAHELLDHVDGMLARAKALSSKTGAYLETMSDTLFSTAHGFMGLVYAYAAYKITGEGIYFILFCFISIGYNLAAHFQKMLLSASSHADADNFLTHNHATEPYLKIIGVPLKQGIENAFRTIVIWQNQLLLWGGLLYFFLAQYNVNTLLIAFLSLAAVNTLYWIACLVRVIAYMSKKT